VPLVTMLTRKYSCRRISVGYFKYDTIFEDCVKCDVKIYELNCILHEEVMMCHEKIVRLGCYTEDNMPTREKLNYAIDTIERLGKVYLDFYGLQKTMIPLLYRRDRQGFIDKKNENIVDKKLDDQLDNCSRKEEELLSVEKELYDLIALNINF